MHHSNIAPNQSWQQLRERENTYLRQISRTSRQLHREQARGLSEDDAKDIRQPKLLKDDPAANWAQLVFPRCGARS